MSSNSGKINSCATSGCNYHCCQFQQGNYIVLYPGELESAEASGQSTVHLKIIDHNYHGGKKAICRAGDTASCDNGFKPLDCISYPFFPHVDLFEDNIDQFIKGKKCPLQTQHLQGHLQTVRAIWNDLITAKPEVAEWLSKVGLVGYTDPSRDKIKRLERSVPTAKAA